MSIKYFCDGCDKPIERNVISQRVVVEKQIGGHLFKAEVMVGEDGASNKGDLCGVCLLKVLATAPELGGKKPRTDKGTHRKKDSETPECTICHSISHFTDEHEAYLKEHPAKKGPTPRHSKQGEASGSKEESTTTPGQKDKPRAKIICPDCHDSFGEEALRLVGGVKECPHCSAAIMGTANPNFKARPEV